MVQCPGRRSVTKPKSARMLLVVKDMFEPGVAERVGLEEGGQIRHPDIDQQALAGDAVALQPENDGPMLNAWHRTITDGDARHDLVVAGDLLDRPALANNIDEQSRE